MNPLTPRFSYPVRRHHLIICQEFWSTQRIDANHSKNKHDRTFFHFLHSVGSLPTCAACNKYELSRVNKQTLSTENVSWRRIEKRHMTGGVSHLPQHINRFCFSETASWKPWNDGQHAGIKAQSKLLWHIQNWNPGAKSHRVCLSASTSTKLEFFPFHPRLRRSLTYYIIQHLAK